MNNRMFAWIIALFVLIPASFAFLEDWRVVGWWNLSETGSPYYSMSSSKQLTCTSCPARETVTNSTMTDHWQYFTSDTLEITNANLKDTKNFTVLLKVNISDYEDFEGLWQRGSGGTNGYLFFTRTVDYMQLRAHGTSTDTSDATPEPSLKTGTWIGFRRTANKCSYLIYKSGAVTNKTFTCPTNLTTQDTIFGRDTEGSGAYYDDRISEIGIYNGSVSDADFKSIAANNCRYPLSSCNSPLTAPVITGLNCTSCNPPAGDTTAPYTTGDTTPTFIFNTDVNAFCRTGDENQNYTTMGNTRNCTGGQGAKSHTCTLTVQDELVFSTDYVHISCANVINNNQANASTSGALQMQITGLGDISLNAIDLGIQSSKIWPGATIYENQQVYLRNLANDQILATVDRVAVSGNQRWIFDHIPENESKAGLFNITPVVYVLEMANMSSSQIKISVENLINSTKT